MRFAQLGVRASVVAVLICACGGDTPSTPPADPDAVRVAMSVADDGDAVSWLVVEVHGGPVATTDTFAVDSGVAHGALGLRQRVALTLSLQAYDGAWTKVAEGSAGVTVAGAPTPVSATLAAADGGGPVTVTLALQVLRVRPFYLETFTGDTGTLHAELLDSYGKVEAAPSPAWSTSSTIVGVAGGLVSALDSGSARVLAQSGGLAAHGRVRVRPPPRVVAHRGFVALFPENTLTAFGGALALGADALETDVRLTRDSVPVLMHDETVDRTTDGHGAVASLAYAQVAALNACPGNASGRCPVPRLRDLLQLAAGRAQVYAEMKDLPDARKVAIVLDEIARFGTEDSVVVASFSPATLQLVRSRNPRIRVALISAVFPDPAVVMPLAPVELVVEQGGIAGAPDRVPWFQSRSVPVLAWTLDRRSQAFRMQELGVRSLVADVQLRNRAPPR